MKTIYGIIIGVIVIALTFLIAYGINEGVIRREQVECQEWLWMASSYPDFYWTSWQIDQCVAVEMYPI